MNSICATPTGKLIKAALADFSINLKKLVVYLIISNRTVRQLITLLLNENGYLTTLTTGLDGAVMWNGPLDPQT